MYDPHSNHGSIGRVILAYELGKRGNGRLLINLSHRPFSFSELTAGKEFPKSFSIAFTSRDAWEDILHPFTRVNTYDLTVVYQRIYYDRGTDSGIVIPAKQEALSPQIQRPDGILKKVLVNAEATVIHVTPQPRHQRQRILYALLR